MLPDALLLDAGTVTTASVGVKPITINQALTRGLYWMVVVFSHAPGIRGHNTDSLLPVMGGASGFGAAMTQSGAVNQALAFGALPANYSSIPTYMTSPPFPLIGIRLT